MLDGAGEETCNASEPDVHFLNSINQDYIESILYSFFSFNSLFCSYNLEKS